MNFRQLYRTVHDNLALVRPAQRRRKHRGVASRRVACMCILLSSKCSVELINFRAAGFAPPGIILCAVGTKDRFRCCRKLNKTPLSSVLFRPSTIVILWFAQCTVVCIFVVYRDMHCMYPGCSHRPRTLAFALANVKNGLVNRIVNYVGKIENARLETSSFTIY